MGIEYLRSKIEKIKAIRDLIKWKVEGIFISQMELLVYNVCERDAYNNSTTA